MTKKPDYQLEFVYHKSQFKKAMWICFGIWLILRITRVGLYLTFGAAFIGSIPAAFIFFFTGMSAGVALALIILYRKSVRVDDIEREKRRLQK
jgi:uncharacterized membrane protein